MTFVLFLSFLIVFILSNSVYILFNLFIYSIFMFLELPVFFIVIIWICEELKLQFETFKY